MTNRLYIGVALLTATLAAALNAWTTIPPLQDFNEWIYQGWIIGQILLGADIPFELKPWPVPNAAGQVLLGLLNLPLPPRAAGIAYATMYLAAITWLAWRLATRDGRVDGARFLLILLIAGINSPYWQGYANSQLGLALFMLHLLRQRRGGSGPAWDTLLGVALFFCHAVMLAVFATFVALRGLRERHLIRAALVLALPFALLGWYLLRDDNYGEEIPLFGTTVFDFVAYKAYTAAKLGPYHNMIIGGLGDADRAPLLYWAGVALNLAFALLVLLPLAFVLLRDIWRGDRSPALLTGLVCLAGFAVLPSAIFGVVNVGERLLLPAMVIALTCCRDPWRLPAILALPAPAMIVYLFLILPATLPTAGIGHLAAHEPGQRWRLLFWHRPFQFQAQIAAAQRGEPIRLGFTTSLLRARAFGPKLSP